MSVPHRAWARVESLAENDPAYMRALHLAVTGSISGHTGVAAEVRDLIDSQSRGRHLIRPVVAAFERGELVSAVAGIESPGASALFLLPFDSCDPSVSETSIPVLEKALELSRTYGVTLAQVVAPSSESKWDATLCKSGMTPTANLEYLLRATPFSIVDPKRSSVPEAMEWITFSLETEPLFCDALRLSYGDSQDCPELTGIRTPKQALLTHAASESFDPASWFVLCQQTRPIGVLLLSMIPRVSVMEIVYMGVSQTERGKGVAGLLLEKAIQVASSAAARNLILAVDARNEPARRLYARWNFSVVARRAAWIANLCAVER